MTSCIGFTAAGWSAWHAAFLMLGALMCAFGLLLTVWGLTRWARRQA